MHDFGGSFGQFEQVNRFVTLISADLRFLVALEEVHHVALLMQIEAVPDSPDFLAGIIDFHGVATPVIDVAMRLGSDNDSNYTDSTLVLICRSLENDMLLGLITEDIGEVLEVSSSQIQLTEQCNSQTHPFHGVVIEKNHVVLWLNIDQLLATSLRCEQIMDAATLQQFLQNYQTEQQHG